MGITNLIISSMLMMNSPVVGGNFNTVSVKPADAIKIAYTAQVVNLIYEDIYLCTKPNVYKWHDLPNGDNIYAGENNPVANLFFKRNLWDIAFLSASAVSILALNLDDNFSHIANIGLSLAEMACISHWDMLKNRNINVKAVLFVYQF